MPTPPLHAPHLEEKLTVLYRRDSQITNDSRLADALAIKQNNIPVWKNGSETRRENLIPSRHVGNMSNLFQIPELEELLKLPTVAAFKQALSEYPLNRAPWDSIVTRSIPSKQIRFRRLDVTSDEQKTRGLTPVLPGEDETERAVPLVHLRLEERVRVELTIPLSWARRMKGNFSYVVLLLISNGDVTCLTPSSGVKFKQNDEKIIFPSSGFFRVTEPRGDQTIYALITDKTLPDVTDVAQIEENSHLLKSLAKSIGSADKSSLENYDWILLKREIYVSPSDYSFNDPVV